MHAPYHAPRQYNREHTGVPGAHMRAEDDSWATVI